MSTKIKEDVVYIEPGVNETLDFNIENGDNSILEVPKEHLSNENTIYLTNSKGTYELVEDDKITYFREICKDDQQVGEKLEDYVSCRFMEYGWEPHKPSYGEHPHDRLLSLKANPLLTARVQIRCMSYCSRGDNYLLSVRCRKDGEKHANYLPNDFDFLIGVLPFSIREGKVLKPAAYIFPMNEVQMFASRITTYPTRQPSQRSLSRLKLPNVNDRFDAWEIIQPPLNQTIKIVV